MKNNNLSLGKMVLIAVNIIIRISSLAFNSYVVKTIGTEGIGLYTLVMSIYGFAFTVAVSGVNLASTRLASEKLLILPENERKSDSYRKTAYGIFTASSKYCLIFSASAGVLLYLTAPLFGKLTGDSRAISSLEMLSITLPATSVLSVMNGYLIGIKKLGRNAILSIIEQVVRIFSTVVALAYGIFGCTSVESKCVAMVFGISASEFITMVISLIIFFFDNKTSKVKIGSNAFTQTHINEVGRIALPVAIGSYVRQGLMAAEHISIPRGLQSTGDNGSLALSKYGILHGMAFPIIFFPNVVTGTYAGILIPELASLKALKRNEEIKNKVRKAYSFVGIFSVFISVILIFFSRIICSGIYKSGEGAIYVRMFAPLIPIMYFDTMVDGVLKGLGEQKYSMYVNIIDSALSFVFALVLVPTGGIIGYIIGVYICETLNMIMSFLRAEKITGIKPDILKNYFIPLSIALGIISVILLFAELIPF